MQGKGVTVNESAESQLEEQLINSFTQNASYQRFLRRMVTKKAATLHPDLVKSFNEKSSRPQLFVDWFKNSEILAKVSVAHKRSGGLVVGVDTRGDGRFVEGRCLSAMATADVGVNADAQASDRRIIRQKKMTVTLKPMRRSKILAMNDGDEAHTELIVQNAIKLGRWRKDVLNPNDESKNVYWVVADEAIEVNNINEQEFMLDGGEVDLSEEQAKQLTASGGYFDEDGDISAPGLSAAAVAGIAASAFNSSPPAPGAAPAADGAAADAGGKGRGRGRGRGKGNPGKGDAAKGDGKGKDGKDGGVPPTVTKDTPYKEANKLMKSTAGA